MLDFLDRKGYCKKLASGVSKCLMTSDVGSFHAVEQVMFLAIGVQHMIQLRTMQMLV